MIVAIKLGITLGILLLLSYPFIPMKGKMRVFSVASKLKYDAPANRKNALFILLVLLELGLVVWLFGMLDKIVSFLYSLPFIGGFLQGLGSQVDFIVFVFQFVIINLIVLYAYVFAKAFVKKVFIDLPTFIMNGKKRGWFRRKKKNKKNGEPAEAPAAEDGEEEKKRKKSRVPGFVHTLFGEEKPEATDPQETKTPEAGEEKPKKKKRNRVSAWILSLFFEGENFEYARGWVVRTRSILQMFVRFVELFYLLFLLLVVLAALFPLPQAMYDILVDVLKIGQWYLYPILSVLLLQEICNVFDADIPEEKSPEEKEKEKEEIEAHQREVKIRKLLAELKKRFDADHSLRYYPEVEPDAVPEYQCTNLMYASALSYIREQMRLSSGHVVQSYMECLDAIYSDEHVYFSASFYSEIGEYLIAYTYIRLLSGARQIFVVSDPDEKETLRTYISDRLMKMTGSSAIASWRVYTADERLEQADVLIVSPEDFIKTDIVEQHPAFFEEACNAIFIDADRLIALDSYLCPIMATKLQNATKDRIRFVFLTLDLIKGFAARSIPKFFCIEKVLSFSSAKENEAVSCVLWNKESKRHRIYHKSGQKQACLETIVAEQAFRYGIDGVRLITESPIEHGERKMLSLHDVEINNLYKNIVDINYMIYSDDRCNLSAALYACTRFRGRKKSVVHILSKPYLLREYFMSKAIAEDHINRSSFIQPRVTEHVEPHKLSFVRIFCDATSEKGMPVSVFEQRVRDILVAIKERNDTVSSAYCTRIIRERDIASLKLSELAAAMIAGICDSDVYRTPEEELACTINSLGNKAKNFYIVVDSSRNAYYNEKYIVFNRAKEVYERLLECNKRVELRLNDETIGLLETFPSRVHLEYVAGQSIIYNNSEYEIDHIAEDGSAIYLRHENISIRHCLDTVFLCKINAADRAECRSEQFAVKSCRDPRDGMQGEARWQNLWLL